MKNGTKHGLNYLYTKRAEILRRFTLKSVDFCFIGYVNIACMSCLNLRSPNRLLMRIVTDKLSSIIFLLSEIPLQPQTLTISFWILSSKIGLGDEFCSDSESLSSSILVSLKQSSMHYSTYLQLQCYFSKIKKNTIATISRERIRSM